MHQVYSYSSSNAIRVTASVLVNDKKHTYEVDQIIGFRHWKIAILIDNNTLDKTSLMPRRIVARQHINDNGFYRYVAEYPTDMWYIMNIGELHKFVRDNIKKWQYKKLDLPYK